MLLGNLEKEVVVLRSSQDNYDTRFRHLDEEKERITVHTEEEIKRLQMQVDELERDKKELRNQLISKKEDESRKVRGKEEQLYLRIEELEKNVQEER